MRTRLLRKDAKSAQQQQKQKDTDMLVREMYGEALWCAGVGVCKVIVGAVVMAVIHVIVCNVKSYFEVSDS
jgi:hypothetical protein|tara:strand:+ start:4961 stop:5173 length:213 start_codon:yes stop_codon:yes gene_type:complete